MRDQLLRKQVQQDERDAKAQFDEVFKNPDEQDFEKGKRQSGVPDAYVSFSGRLNTSLGTQLRQLKK